MNILKSIEFLKDRDNLRLIIGIFTFILGVFLLELTFYNFGKYISYIPILVGLALIIDFGMNYINIKDELKKIITIVLSIVLLVIIVFIICKIKLYSGHPAGVDEVKKYLQNKYPTDEFEIIETEEIILECNLDSKRKDKIGYRTTVKSIKQQANFIVEDSFDESKNCKYKLTDNYSYNIGG